MSGALATRTISACPSWCEEPAGHRNVDDDPLEDPAVRTHVGRFGLFEVAVTEGFSEVALAKYRREFGAKAVDDMQASTVELVDFPGFSPGETPTALRQLAADALKAAEWLESQASA